MPYPKTTWVNTPATSSPVNATNLNKIEQGIFDAQRQTTYVDPPTGVAATDNQALTNAIVVAAGLGYGDIVFAAGNYNITGTGYTLAANGSFTTTTIKGIRFRGMGRGVTILTYAPVGATSLFTVGDGTNTTGFVTFEDMSIVLNSSTAVAGIRLRDPCNFCVIQRVQFLGLNVFQTSGIRIDGQVAGNTDHHIKNCTFRTMLEGIRFSGNANSNLVQECAFASVSAGIRAELVGAPDTLGGQNNTVERCEFGTAVSTGAMLRSSSAGWTFIGCNFGQDNATTTIELPTGSDFNTFVGCRFVAGAANGINLAGTAANTTTIVGSRRGAVGPELFIGGWNVRTGITAAGQFDILRQGSANSILKGGTADELFLSYTGGKIGLFGATPIVRPAGWVAATGVATRGTFVTSTPPSLQVLAEHLKALEDDLLAIGIIGP